MVPAARVELAPHCWDLNLNQARLPIPPRGHRGNPRKGAGLPTHPWPSVQAQSPTHSYSSAWPLGIGDLTCGDLSHIIPDPIFGFNFQTKQNHECTEITQRHVARTCR